MLLDCTLQDGNYAVGYKFTAAGTALLVAEIERLGFRWIEIGHGLGLGAMEAGEGDMPASDRELLRAARESRRAPRIGTFFIPGIGDFHHLEMAKGEGADFVRIGDNAPQIERAYPYVTRARDLSTSHGGSSLWISTMVAEMHLLELAGPQPPPSVVGPREPPPRREVKYGRRPSACPMASRRGGGTLVRASRSRQEGVQGEGVLGARP